MNASFVDSPAPGASPRLTRAAGAHPVNVEFLFRAHASKVGRWVEKLVGASNDVEDVVQDVFLAVQQVSGTSRGEASASSWLFAITRRVAREHRRRLRRAHAETEVSFVQTDAADVSDPAVAFFERRRRAHAFQVALTSLRPKHREVIVLRDLEGRSGAEVARLLEIPENRVCVRLFRARRALAAGLFDKDLHDAPPER
jgi:RNA polymerase sigma-70 factor (ECF subfamily)